jgi:tyrosine phenol-lyase
MNDRPVGVLFSVPYEIAAVRQLRQTSLQERESALKAAGYNCELLPQELIYVDLCTDSGVSALSMAQITSASGIQAVEPSMGMAFEASGAFASLSQQYRKIFGFPYLVPTTQGRAAERIWAKTTLNLARWYPATCCFRRRECISSQTAPKSST